MAIPQFYHSETKTRRLFCRSRQISSLSTRHSDNLTFIGFAPYENPEIAVAVVIEYGGKGDAAKETAKAVFEAYFAETLQKEAKRAETTVTEGTE